MKTKIGSNVLASIEPRPAPYEICDTELRGFRVRVQPSGVMSFVCTYRTRGGQRHRVVLGRHPAMSPAQARDEARKVLGDVARGMDPATERTAEREKVAKGRAEHTIESVLRAEYRPWGTGHLKDYSLVEGRLKGCFGDLYPKKLNQVTQWQIEKWRSERMRKGISPVTVNRDVAELRALLSKAVQWGFLSEYPLAKMKPVKTNAEPVVRWLADDEERRLRTMLGAREDRLRSARARATSLSKEPRKTQDRNLQRVPLADHLKPMVLLAMNTGIRQGELFALEWTDVDLARAMLAVRARSAKSGRVRYVPLNDEALEALRRWKLQCGTKTLVFESKGGLPFNNVKKAWGRVLVDAKIEGFRWHDLRHHFASRLVMEGVDLNTVRELLGHADIKMTLRYAHLAPEHKAAAVAKLGRVA